MRVGKTPWRTDTHHLHDTPMRTSGPDTHPRPRPLKDLAVHDVKVRILSDVALIHGRSTYTMLADGTEQEALYTDAYQKRQGTWVCVSACAIAPGT